MGHNSALLPARSAVFAVRNLTPLSKIGLMKMPERELMVSLWVSLVCTHRLSRACLLRLFPAVLFVPLLLGCGGETPRDLPSSPQPTRVIVRLPMVTPRPTATPAPATPWPTATPAPTPTPLIHIIAAGDNLWDLSRRYGVSVSALQEANAILNPRGLQLGQAIVIPWPEPEDDQAVPTPTPLAYTIQGLAFHKTTAGSLWCLGEVWNTTGITLEEVQVRVTLYDEAGQLAATAQGVPSLGTIAPDQRVPFALLFRDPPQSFAHYQAQPLRGTAALPGSHHYAYLTIAEDRGEAQDGRFLIRGQIYNTGSLTATARLVATAYDAQGNVIGLRSQVLPTPLAPGVRHPFTVTLLPASQPVSSYTIQVQGLEEGQGR